GLHHRARWLVSARGIAGRQADTHHVQRQCETTRAAAGSAVGSRQRATGILREHHPRDQEAGAGIVVGASSLQPALVPHAGFGTVSRVARANERPASPRRIVAITSVTFVRGAARAQDLPKPTLPEIALAGRSNVGKSSLLNRLVGRTRLARVSKTPGRTQQI